ncbi:MAG: hypothetical protein OZ913_02115 [Ignavibacteriaceae bacterium]|nr:MAG: hypothetical protein EDM69_07345 [Chlorobiota bacterium]KXK04706.1 MAG: hypothetical protein UZ04_CHB001001085 [Chlorobi bacterium OLB4]MBV6399432.1 hypothetical protein [Ignavibacteria bacterium]MCC6886724.1 hypothetical protein [Ignavibacteriales bacterium]MCE7953137.1 hypothetical protein [Chlorobi bacterium CHB7]MEB2329080.1 hypothetical protein [Ignavibacteriaceae bacterium]OQY76615.1 MAG: hypothetical protein B6D43_10590 [Ignavibacteriales bacterium UTCHB1]RIK50012.1 MAG: hypot
MQNEFEELQSALREFDRLLDKPGISKDEVLDQLGILLEKSNFNSDEIARYKKYIDEIQGNQIEKKINRFKKFDEIEFSDREKYLNDFEMELNIQKLTSDEVHAYKKRNKLLSISKFLIALMVMVIGISVILLPLSDEFKVFTIYYFNPNDGITLIDVFGLVLIFGSIYLILNSRKHEY